MVYTTGEASRIGPGGPLMPDSVVGRGRPYTAAFANDGWPMRQSSAEAQVFRDARNGPKTTETRIDQREALFGRNALLSLALRLDTNRALLAVSATVI